MEGKIKVSNILNKKGKTISYGTIVEDREFDNWKELVDSNMIEEIEPKKAEVKAKKTEAK